MTFALFTPGALQAAAEVATLSIADLDVPMRGTSPLRFSSLATGISSDGIKVVGSWLTTRTATSQQGWLAPDATGRYKAVDIGSTGGQGAALTGVNNSQTIVGSRRLNGTESAIYALPPYFDPNTGVLTFPPQSIAGLTGQSRALGINNNNGIVGFDSSGSNGTPQAFYAAVGESARHIDKLGGAASMAFAVNNDQLIAGWAMNQASERQAFVARSASGDVTLPDIPGSHWSEARAINQRGDIAGCFAARTIAGGDCSGSIPATSKSTGDSNSQEVRAFVVQNGKAQILDLPQGYTESFALGLSDSGIVVGKAHAIDPITGAAKDTAFLWVDGTTLDLSQYLPTHAPQTGWESLSTATAVTGSLITDPTGEHLTATIVGQGMMWGADPLDPATLTLLPHAFRLDVTYAITDTTGPALSALSYAGAAVVEGQTLGHSALVSVAAADPSGVARVEFLLDGQRFGLDQNGADGYAALLDLSTIADGNHQLTARGYDSLNNSSALARGVLVALAAPSAPSIAQPASGLATNRKQLTVSGSAEPRAAVQIYAEGSALGAATTADTAGAFSATVTLADGANHLEASASNRGGAGPFSGEILVTLDTSIPSAPTGVAATAQPSGRVRITWSSSKDGNVAGYHVYRASAAFTDIAQATRVNSSRIVAQAFDDLPPGDGQFWYRVVAENRLGTLSDPSNQAAAVADSTAPRALAIEYVPTRFDPATQRIGRGAVGVTLRLSEPVAATPFLSIAPAGGTPIALSLARVSDTEYHGAFEVTDVTPSGTAFAVFSARDAAGNRGTDVASGATLEIDAAGPAVTGLSVAPADPIKNSASQPRSVTLTLTLSEPMKPGTLPQLSYRLSAPGRTPVQLGAIVQSGPVEYRATFTLPADAGASVVEYIQFSYAGADDLDNTSTSILAPNRFQVYQGDLPPAGVPGNVAATALPGGKVKLTWSAVDDASAYQVYRQSPGDAALVAYQRTTGIDFTDATTGDGLYRYAVASIRMRNGEEGLSAPSVMVEAKADASVPDAPRELVLGLSGPGVLALWKAPTATDVDSYNVYRSSAPAITSVQGLMPIKTGVKGLAYVDPAPSPQEHSYVVTALDAAGNESAISNSAYLNFTLLPVSSLRVTQSGTDAPVISWTHAGAGLAGFDLYLGPDAARIKLNNSLLSVSQFTDTGYAGDERRYTVAAVDGNGASIGRSIVLPRLTLKLTGGAPLRRGLLNRLQYEITNGGAGIVPSARLRVTLAGRDHVSELFSLGPAETRIIPVIVGGQPQLDSQSALTASIELTPNEGESVTLARSSQIAVEDGSLTLAVQSEALSRGGSGKVRFTLSNTSDVDTQIVTARGSGSLPSDEVRVKLLDADGNVLSVQPLTQVLSNVTTYASGVSVAAVAPGASFTSEPVALPIPSGAPTAVSVAVEIDHLYYKLGEPDGTSVAGPSGRKDAQLIDTAYYAEVSSIAPPSSFGERNVVITGRAVDRRSGLALAAVPLKLVLSLNGFERSFDLFTDATGAFSFAYQPQPGDAGVFVVSALHPDTIERPDQGRFVINRVSITPTQITLKSLRNTAQTITVNAVTGEATSATNLHLVYEAADQPLAALPTGVNVTLGAPVSLNPRQAKTLSFEVSAGNQASDSGALVLKVLSNERGSDPVALIRIDYRFFDPNSQAGDVRAALFPTPSYVETSVARSSSVTEQVALENQGLVAAGDVRVTLQSADGAAAPSWVALSSPATLGTLAVGARTTVDITASPSPSVAEGIYSLKLHVSGANIPAGDVNVFVSVTQSGVGNALFKAADIYTGRLDATSGRPIAGLAGVSIQLQNELVASVQQTLATDALGEALFSNLPAGSYKFRASIANHQETGGRLLVKPSLTATQDIFLDNNLVTVQWRVRETTIQDRYEITLNATFETDVPAAVVLLEPGVVNLPDLKAGDVYYGELTLTNYGLVRADNVKPQLPRSDAYLRYEFLSAIPSSLEAKQRISLPYRIVALKSFAPDGNASGGGCFNYGNRAFIGYDFQCANGSTTSGGTEARWAFNEGNTCATSLLGGFNLGGTSSGTGGGGEAGGGSAGDTGGSDLGGVGSATPGGFVNYVPDFAPLSGGGGCVPGCNGSCCSGGGAGNTTGAPAGGGAGSPSR